MDTMIKRAVKEVAIIKLTPRQLQILEIVNKYAPITGDQIAERLNLTKSTLRSDLTLLVGLEHIDAKPKVGYSPGSRNVNRLGVKLSDTLVKTIQSMPIIIRETTTIQDAVVTLFLQDVGTLFVCDAQERLTGVTSRKDFLKVTLGNPAAASMPVSMVMTRQPKVITVHPEDTALDAAHKMIMHEIDSLPVVVPVDGEDGSEGMKVVGRLTKTSIVKLILDSETNGG